MREARGGHSLKNSLTYARDTSDDRTTALLKFAQSVYNAGWLGLSSRRPIGTNIFSRDWDALVILDACRLDALRELASEYPFLDTVDSMWSVGSATAEWTAKTFTSKYLDTIAETAYVSANWYTKTVLIDHVYPPTDDILPFDWSRWDVVDAAYFAGLEGVWDWEDGYSERLHTIPAPYVTDRAIARGRTGRHDRLIVHYTQPHVPYVGRGHAATRELRDVELDPWPAFNRGEVSRSELWTLYLDNLRYVLDDVGVLLENLDAETVAITADHGEAFGEWGAYAHPLGFPHPSVKRVPWALTTASDTGTREPAAVGTHDGTRVDQRQFLEDLGYL